MSFPTWNTDWFPLPRQAVFDRNTQKIAAVSRAPGCRRGSGWNLKVT